MKRFYFPWMFVISSLILLILVCLSQNKELSDYSTRKSTMCVTLNKIFVQPSKSGSSEKFLLVLKDNKNREFTLDVTPETYTNAKIGKPISFKISEGQIAKNSSIEGKEFLIFFLAFITAICVIIGFCIFVSDISNNWSKILKFLAI